MELQEASFVMRINICIHRNLPPRWYIQNFDMHATQMIHFSYHDGEHHNSLRSKDDDCSGPAKPTVIKALKEACGDVEAAIGILTAEKESVDHQISHDELCRPARNSYENIKK
ncbi:OVARIAN TUMOR DOMAIN-containing deubiquitinating enzyme 7 isoform X2 [Primulina eburnea]|uniref:OVARIAN TUMOR DOMAIN-containing deubiquitinating enzyme 7 isoform X2 n=1 Tax=Primulina eburnea TaxID=1245227 RepID=UPI003C6C7D80